MRLQYCAAGGTQLETFASSLRLDVGCPDHFTPFLGLPDDEVSEVSGRTREYLTAEISQPRLHLRIGQSGVDLLIELVDDIGRRVLGCPNAPPSNLAQNRPRSVGSATPPNVSRW
jgi:hypothetical protein